MTLEIERNYRISGDISMEQFPDYLEQKTKQYLVQVGLLTKANKKNNLKRKHFNTS